ncbi:MAG TPA: hypothetical protein VNN55_09180 [bacterium]|nr:hypothetical protein [bacterium]
MSASRRRQLLFALLVGSAVFGLYMKPWERRRPTVGSVADESAPMATNVATMTPSTVPVLVADVGWPARDPFAQPGEFPTRRDDRPKVADRASLPRPSLRLQGIVGVDGTRSCVIGGEVHCVGTTVQGWMITEIAADGIWLSRAGQRLFVPLKSFEPSGGK